MMTVPCMYTLLDESVPWVYLMTYYYGFNDGLIN